MHTWRIDNQCGIVLVIVTSWSDLRHFCMRYASRSSILQVLVKADLLKFVNGNVLMDIDVPTVLVVTLPLDALSYKEAIIFIFGTNLKIFAEVGP